MATLTEETLRILSEERENNHLEKAIFHVKKSIEHHGRKAEKHFKEMEKAMEKGDDEQTRHHDKMGWIHRRAADDHHKIWHELEKLKEKHGHLP